MKIKEVIEKTELTDRAIRLYIDEGLVKPNIEESYSGRKNIDFSDDDVKRLNNVALLRKAGFSIADIKSIIENKETAKDIIETFIQQTEQNIIHNTQVVEKLKSISFDEEISLETICNSLSETVKETAVPKEDLKPKASLEAIRKFCLGFGIFGMVVSVCGMVVFIILCKICFIQLDLKQFISVSWPAISTIIVMFALTLAITLLNRKSGLQKKKYKTKMITSSVLFLILIPLSVCSFYLCILTSLFNYSLTYDIDDYLVLDSWIDEDFGTEIDAVFPDEIPQSAIKNPDRYFDNGIPLTTKYYYTHTYVLDPDFDLIAEWILPKEEYELAKKEITASVKHTEKRGDWVLNYYADTQEPEDWDDAHYWFLIFAYNDSTRQVRYIAAYAIDSFPEGPYYLSLDW
ncbi:MAG: MerR family transcriptional regulator [Clostridia bacterium]|nr:MerR family transcriptional regulator [Clostridia bacterium]